MIKFIESYFSHVDNRGCVTGLVNEGVWEEANHIVSEPGVTRGDHFHTVTREFFFIIEGLISIHLQAVDDGVLVGEVETYIVRTGDTFIIEPMVNHKFLILQRAAWINLLDRRSGVSPDIFRLATYD